MGGVHRFEDLICWQLSVDLKKRVYAVLKRPLVAREFDLCRQIRNSARSAPALIAEGFERWTRPEFIRYLRLAKGELGETRNHVLDAADAQLIDAEELRQLSHVCYRARRACEALIVSLLRKNKQENKRRRKRKRTNRA